MPSFVVSITWLSELEQFGFMMVDGIWRLERRV
jgi:hypothetical protein